MVIWIIFFHQLDFFNIVICFLIHQRVIRQSDDLIDSIFPARIFWVICKHLHSNKLYPNNLFWGKKETNFNIHCITLSFLFHKIIEQEETLGDNLPAGKTTLLCTLLLSSARTDSATLLHALPPYYHSSRNSFVAWETLPSWLLRQSREERRSHDFIGTI